MQKRTFQIAYSRRLFLKEIVRTGGILTLFLGGFPLGGTMAVTPDEAIEYAIAGQEHIRNHEFEKAIEKLNLALTQNPENDWIYGLLGRAYFGLQQYSQAINAFKTAVRINPRDSYSRMMIDYIRQYPYTEPKPKHLPLTPLEKAVQHEEETMMDRFSTANDSYYQLNRIVIDPGHGGFDPGAMGPSGLQEKEVVLKIGVSMHNTLNQMGYQSFLTRTADYYVPLNARTATANQFQADLFISLHCNSSHKNDVRGLETYYCSESASGENAKRVAAFENSPFKKDTPYKPPKQFIDIEEILFQIEQKIYWRRSNNFARQMQSDLQNSLPFPNRGVHSANFFVLRRNKMPSLLLELGFISNPTEETLLRRDTTHNQIARAIAAGIKRL